MAITIRLHGNGLDYNNYMKSYLNSFVSTGFPYMEEDDQIILASTDEGAATPAIILDGENFEYTMSTHIVAGTLEEVTFAELGDAYNTDGSWDIDANGHIVGYAPIIEFEGLNVSNGPDTKGDFHEIVAEFMYLGGSSSEGTPTFFDVINSQSQKIIGTSGADKVVGTAYNDTLQGGDGNDRLSGGDGNDLINGGKGNDFIIGGGGDDILKGSLGADILIGGPGHDKLWGGAGWDIFRFTHASQGNALNRDTIMDFNEYGVDVIDLSRIDADATTAGNQSFVFIGEEEFSGTAGELRVDVRGDNALLLGDLNGDGNVQFAITLLNYTDVTADDLLL